jgi:hypothetical protein
MFFNDFCQKLRQRVNEKTKLVTTGFRDRDREREVVLPKKMFLQVCKKVVVNKVDT